MSRPIPAGDYVEHFDPELAHHRAWLLAVLEHLIAHEPQALEEGVLHVLWLRIPSENRSGCGQEGPLLEQILLGWAGRG